MDRGEPIVVTQHSMLQYITYVHPRQQCSVRRIAKRCSTQDRASHGLASQWAYDTVAAVDSPYLAGILLRYLMRFASQHRYKVLLAGPIWLEAMRCSLRFP